MQLKLFFFFFKGISIWIAIQKRRLPRPLSKPTWYGPAEDRFFVVIVAEAHGHRRGARDRFTDVGAVNHVSGLLPPQTGCSLSHHKPQSIHHIRLTLTTATAVAFQHLVILSFNRC